MVSCFLQTLAGLVSGLVSGGIDHFNKPCGHLMRHAIIDLDNTNIFFLLIVALWCHLAIWRHRPGSTLTQVMACCLMKPSHYPSQCWLIISKAQCHSFDAFSQKIHQPSISKISLEITYHIMAGSAFVVAKKVFIMETIVFWHCDNGWMTKNNYFGVNSALPLIIKSPQYTGGDFMFLYRFVRRRHRRRHRRLRRRPQILVHAITFEQLFGFPSFLAQLLALTCRLPD